MTIQPGWPALRLPGHDVPLPIVRPWEPEAAPAPAGQARQIGREWGRGYVDLALDQFLDYSPNDRRTIAIALSPRGHELDRHPQHLPNGDDPPYNLLIRASIGRPARAVMLAGLSDLVYDGRSQLWRPTTRDHLRAMLGEQVDESNARKLRAYGRRVMHRLGCWPWVLEPDGKLPYGWSGVNAVERIEQRHDPYVDDLRVWFEQEAGRRRAALDIAAELLAG